MSELDVDGFESIKRYVEFDQTSIDALRDLHPTAFEYFPQIVEDFYEAIQKHPEAREVITGGDQQVDRLKKTLLGWLQSVLLGPYDQAYLKTHSRIGSIHVRIGLPQQYMFTAMHRIRTHLLEIAQSACAADPQASRRATRAVNQILDLELAIMLDAYRVNFVERARNAERLATIGQLAATVGHELRNPLGIVESSLFLIRQRLKALGVEDPNVQKHDERILGQLKTCGKTIANLLDLAQNRAPDRRRIGFRSLLDHALEQSGVALGTRVLIEVDPTLEIEVDPDDFVHVIVNLLVNASDAQSGTGSVAISARESNGGVEIVVRDDGPGIPTEIRSRIFEALFTTKPRGTGLGLALCRRILEAHGGEIQLEPSEGGARFRLWIPHREPP